MERRITTCPIDPEQPPFPILLGRAFASRSCWMCIWVRVPRSNNSPYTVVVSAGWCGSAIRQYHIIQSLLILGIIGHQIIGHEFKHQWKFIANISSKHSNTFCFPKEYQNIIGHPFWILFGLSFVYRFGSMVCFTSTCQAHETAASNLDHRDHGLKNAKPFKGEIP